MFISCQFIKKKTSVRQPLKGNSTDFKHQGQFARHRENSPACENTCIVSFVGLKVILAGCRQRYSRRGMEFERSGEGGRECQRSDVKFEQQQKSPKKILSEGVKSKLNLKK